MHRITIEIQGGRGSGKTRAALAIREALEDDGWFVIHKPGGAPSLAAIAQRSAGRDSVAVIIEQESA